MSARQSPDLAVLLDGIAKVARSSNQGRVAVSNILIFDEITRVLSGSLVWPDDVPPVERYAVTGHALRELQQAA